MPLYEYECRKCGRRFEVIQRFADDPLTTCESCGGTLKKLLSAPAVQFKGTGWYVTDYASRSGSADSKERGGASQGSGSEGGEKSESKGSGKGDEKAGKKASPKSSDGGSSSDSAASKGTKKKSD